MFDFGDELTLESYRVPWLIWIQLLVMLLLIFLLYCFSIFAFDLSDNNNNSSSAEATSSSTSQITSANESHRDQSRRDTTTATATTGSHSNKVGEHIQESSTKDASDVARFRDSHHPCHYFGLARQAFLKCLGLDSLFDSSSERRKRKDS